MSSPSRRRPPVPVRERATCMCASGNACSSFEAGHALHLIQARLASATPSEWVDALVTATAGAEITVRTLEGAEIVLFHAAGIALDPGEPVALHARYGVLSVRGALRNAAVLAGAVLTPRRASTP